MGELMLLCHTGLDSELGSIFTQGAVYEVIDTDEFGFTILDDAGMETLVTHEEHFGRSYKTWFKKI